MFRAEGQGQKQKAQPRRHGQIPHPLGSLQIPQGPAHQQVHQHADHHGRQLLDGCIGGNGGNGCHAQGTQEKGNGFHFKGAAADDQIEEVQQPLGEHDARKAGHHQRRIGHGIVQREADNGHELKNGEQQQIQRPGNGTGGAGAQPGLQGGLLLGDELQFQLYPAHGDGIPVLEGADVHPLAVDVGSVLGAGVGDCPAAVIIPGQNCVIPGYGGQGNGHITVFAAANDVFPVGDGNPVSIGHHQPAPDFRLPPKG